MQLVLIAAVAAGGWYAWKAVKREMARIDEEVRQAEKIAGKPKDTLEYDPATSKYRPKKAD